MYSDAGKMCRNLCEVWSVSSERVLPPAGLSAQQTESGVKCSCL